MKKKINLIVKDCKKNIRVDVFINDKQNGLSRTRIKKLILDKKLSKLIIKLLLIHQKKFQMETILI